MSRALDTHTDFIPRHIGPSDADQAAMLAVIGSDSLDALIEEVVPPKIRSKEPLALPASRSEADVLAELKQVAGRNKVYRSYIGQGYYGTQTPNVVLRNILENPAWYTAYTPYQPEISQGRLEALLNYQTMVADLTGLDISNASLLDESTAAAEAMTLARRSAKSKSPVFFISRHVHPQTIEVVRTRAEGLDIEIRIGDEAEGLPECFGVLLQYPHSTGSVSDYRKLAEAAHAQGAVVACATDLLALAVLAAPGEWGADIAVGSAQRFGVPFGFGGPHAGFMACKDAFKRNMAGRLVGVSKDAQGNPALRLALQTREQHIRREKATSNICTAQVLLAVMAGMYAVWHGPAGIRRIAERVQRATAILRAELIKLDVKVANDTFFDTLLLETGAATPAILTAADCAHINLRRVDGARLAISLDETVTVADLEALVNVFAAGLERDDVELDIDALDAAAAGGIPASVARESAILTHPIFSSIQSETDMLRYLRKLADKDLALDRTMIPLGSCTMKLNATSEMIPITWPGFARMHPFAPAAQATGYKAMIDELERWLCAITGFDAICMQPNSGAQGEYAGLMAITRYHRSRHQPQRTLCLIPSSAHGTNPASAQMAGMEVVIVDCDEHGNVDLADLKAKAHAAGERLSCLMVTYPSTHGVYEEGIREICEVVHQHGGQVYMDGANLNAQVGLTRPADIGADVSHMNLHKTFCIPHGGGGPGMGPIGIRAHLTPFVASHPVVPVPGLDPNNSAVSAAPWGSASILPISWMYIAMMGPQLADASEVAILSANYLASQLGGAFPVLYRGRNQRVAHECILDLRPLKTLTGISEEDVAKRLMDYGFHAPTMSFPVPGTLMVEPTESESKAELDRFVEAMLAIRAEIGEVQEGNWPAENNPLKHAPHTLADVLGVWDRPYSLEQGVAPSAHVRQHKYWPAVNRVDNVYGDRNLFCACVPVEAYR